MRVWFYVKIFFFLWVALTVAQPLLVFAMTLPSQKDLNSQNYKLNTLFKVSELAGFLESIEAIVEMTENFDKGVLAPGQKELSRKIMRKTYSQLEFYHTLEQSFIEDYKPQYVRLVLQWYQSELGKKILRLENEAKDPKQRLAMKSFLKKLLDAPPSKARKRLVESVERSANYAEAGATLYLLYVRLMQPFNNKVKTEGLGKKLQALKGNSADSLREVILHRMLFMYRDITNKDLKLYAAFLDSPAGQWFSRAQLKGFNKALRKATYKIDLIKVRLLKEIDSGGPNYPLLKKMVPPGQRHILLRRRDPFRPLVNKKGLVGFAGIKQDSSEVRLFGGELMDIPPLALYVFTQIEKQHPKLHRELTNFQNMFSDRKVLEEMEDEEYAKAIKNYRNVLERSAGIKMEISALQIEYDALRMTGVILKKNEGLAIFEIKKTGYAVKKGDLIGPSFGTVKKVKDGQVIVIEKFRDYQGNILKHEKIIQFRKAHLYRLDKNL